MKIGKLDISNWRYNGMKLVPLHKLILRLMVYPIIYICALIICAATLIGWDVSESNDMWKNIGL